MPLSAKTGGRSAAGCTSNAMSSPITLRRSRDVCWITAFTSRLARWIICLRLKTSSWRVRPAANVLLCAICWTASL